MKSLFLVLLIANLAAGAWLLLQAPVGVVREPGRMDLQLEQGRVRVLGEAEVAQLRQKAQSDAAAAEVAAGAAAATATALTQTPAGTATAAGGAAGVEMPLASCIDIGPFGAESATRKIRARLAAAGLTEHVSTATTDKVTRLRITGVDAVGEAQVHLILRDFPRQEMNHCVEAAAAGRGQ